MLPSPTSGAITIERQTHSLLQFAWLVRGPAGNPPSNPFPSLTPPQRARFP